MRSHFCSNCIICGRAARPAVIRRTPHSAPSSRPPLAARTGAYLQRHGLAAHAAHLCRREAADAGRACAVPVLIGTATAQEHSPLPRRFSLSIRWAMECARVQPQPPGRACGGERPRNATKWAARRAPHTPSTQ
eukprot:scaffold1134_cov295-Prasinococcus_capsulatus_cf.AAC.8